MDRSNFSVSKIFSDHLSLFLRYTALLLDILAHYNWQLYSLRGAFRKLIMIKYNIYTLKFAQMNAATNKFNHWFQEKKVFLPLLDEIRSRSYPEQKIMN